MTDKLRWGILSTGRIAGVFANGVAESRSGTVVAVGSRTQEAADRFGQEHGIGRRHGSYEALLADPDVQAVYVATPHPMHAEWAIKTAEAGKHVLCEKPLTLNYPEAMAVAEAARRGGVLLMEAFMYRCSPQTARLVELIREGAIGRVRLISATFGFNGGWNPESRLLAQPLGGGGILDVGCYTVSMARLLAGAAIGEPFSNPIEVKALGCIGETRVDEVAIADMVFPGGILAQVATSVQANLENVVRVYGSEGTITVPSPWFCGPTDGQVRLYLQRGGQPREDVVVPTDRVVYAYEADAFAQGVQDGTPPHPAMSAADSLGNMRTLDRWRLAIGLQYDMEVPEGQTLPASGRKLGPLPGSRMKYGRLEGLDKQVSRLVAGTMLEGAVLRIPHAHAMLDDFVERGGNCFDTAYVYGSEGIFGNWVKQRGVRDQVAVICKGAHTPFCTPDWLTRQLMESLDNLMMDCVDIYMMHRDNPDVPVGEFVDVLNAHVQAGRIKVFGGSNWSLERIEEANRYAGEHGLQGFTAVSNNLSLARMVEAPWDGCIASSDPASLAWLTERQMPVFSWSSQARGFFGRGDRSHTAEPEMMRCWYAEDNFRRLDRAREMAAERGVLPINVAAAYVLCQPFPTFALIGPSSMAETRTALDALDIELTPDEMRWLNLETDTKP